MDQVYNHALTYASLTLNTNKDVIKNLPKNEENEHLKEGKSHQLRSMCEKSIDRLSTREKEVHHGGTR